MNAIITKEFPNAVKTAIVDIKKVRRNFSIDDDISFVCASSMVKLRFILEFARVSSDANIDKEEND